MENTTNIKMVNKIKNLKDQIKQLEKAKKIVTTCFLVLTIITLLGASFMLYVSLQEYNDIKLDNPQNITEQKLVFELVNITYENLTEDQIDYFNSIFQNVKPYYLLKIRNVVITDDATPYCKGSPCGGSHHPRTKTIYIEYNEKESEIKRVVSHELLHSWILNSGGNLENSGHKIVNELGKLHVAFNE